MILNYGNVKGRTGSAELLPVTVIVGDNFAGKSTVLIALRLALLGYEPSVAATPRGIWQLSSGPKMAVQLDDREKDLTIQRQWWLEKDTVKSSVRKSSESLTVPKALVDMREFLMMPAKQRSAYILSLVPIPDEAVSREKLAPIFGPTSELEAETMSQLELDLIEFLDFWIGNREEYGTPNTQWLSEMLAEVEVKAKNAKAAAMEAEAVVRRFLTTDEAAGKNCADEIEQLSKAADVKKQALAKLAGRAASERTIAQIQERFDELKKSRDELQTMDAVAGEIGAKPIGERLEAQRQLVRDCDEALKKAQAAIEDGKRKRDVHKGKKCPTCGHEVSANEKGYKAADKLVQAMIKQSGKLIAALEKETDELTTLQQAVARGNDLQRVQSEFEKLSVFLDQTKATHAKTYGDVTGDAPELEEELRGINAKLGTAKAQHQLWERAKDLQARRAQAELDSVSANCERDMWGAAAKGLKALQDKAVAAAFGSFIATVRKFTDGILRFTPELHDGEIGYFTNGVWVSAEVLSGSEKALVYAGLGVAMAQHSPVKIVMVDEVILSPATKKKVAARMWDLAMEGVIDSFVCVDVAHADWPKEKTSFVNVA